VQTSTIGAQRSCQYLNFSRLTLAIVLQVGLSSSRCKVYMLIHLYVCLSLLSGCIHRRWTSLSLSAFWCFNPAPPVGSSVCFKRPYSADDLSHPIGIVAWEYCNWCVGQPERHDSVLELPILGAIRGVVLVPFFHSDAVIEIPEVLSSISEISGRGYQLFTRALSRAWKSTLSCSPPSIFAYEIDAGTGGVYLSQLFVSLALNEIS